MAVISKDIKLSYKTGEGSFVALTNLQEIPDLGGDTESIEITVLSDGARTYTEGLKNYGESIDFTFLYEKAQFNTLEALEGENEWQVELPDGATCTFTGTSSVKLNGVGVNEALTYALSVKPSTEMAWA
jgi:hypothetical protein